MTKVEVDVAGTLGVPVMRTDQDIPIDQRRKYRVLSVMKRYPEQYERERGKKAVNLVEIIEVNPYVRSSTILPMGNIEPADPVQFQAVMKAYTKAKEPPEQEKEPSKRTKEPPEKPDTGAEKSKKKRKEPFVKPDIAEVAAYAVENGYQMDPQAFMDHYDACGWVVGKNKPMRDWMAAVRNWVRRNGEFGGAGTETGEKQSSFNTDDFFAQALKNSYGDEYEM